MSKHTPPNPNDICPGDYVETRGNVGSVEINPDGSRTILVYPAEITKHVRRPADQPVERRAVSPHVHTSGYVTVCPLWFTATVSAGATMTFPIYSVAA